jgi:hypothetical protein
MVRLFVTTKNRVAALYGVPYLLVHVVLPRLRVGTLICAACIGADNTTFSINLAQFKIFLVLSTLGNIAEK